jgi:hypothetical protein
MVTYDFDYPGEFRQFGTEDGGLVWLVAIGLDRAGDVYISDEHRHDVQVFDHQIYQT